MQKRKNGEVKSQVADGVDLLSLFLQNQEVFDDDGIIDELIDFFGAGTELTQFSIQTFVSVLI